MGFLASDDEASDDITGPAYPRRKRRLQPLAGQRSKIEDEDGFEYEDDKNKAGGSQGLVFDNDCPTHPDPLCAGA